MSRIQKEGLQTWLFCSAGVLASAATSYLVPGTGLALPTELKINIPYNCNIKNLYIKSQTAPGVGLTDTWTIRKNGVDTTLTANLSGNSQTENSDITNIVQFSIGDDLSLKQISDLLTASSDVVITLDIQIV